MSIRGIVLSLVLPAFALPAVAQERNAAFQAAMVVADYQTRFQQLGDINGDGYADAYSAWWMNDSYSSLRVAAFLNDGTGKLAPAWTSSMLVSPANTTTWTFVAGDVDGDGLADLVAGAGIVLSFFKTGPGGTAPSSSVTWYSPSAITGVALLDVDGDGVKEIAVLAGNLTILRYNGSPLLTSIGALTLNAVGGELRNADVDGRGTPDLLAWDATRVWMIPMQGAVPETPTMFFHGCGDPRGAAGDIDNDGDEDVVVFDMGQYVVFRRTSPTTYVQEPMQIGGPARFLYDIDGDGFLDGVCCGGGGPSPVHNDAPSIFRIAMNDGTGNFAPALEMPGLGSIRLAGAADLDHDGDLDLVAGRCVFYSPKKLLDNLPRKLPFVAGTSGTARENAFADLDGDSDLDLEPGMTTGRNLGDASFAGFAPVLPAPPAGRTWVASGFPGDFDGDGDLDLVVAQFAGATFEHMELLKNCGGGSFVDAGPAAGDGVNFSYSTNGTTRARDCLAKDLDGDGDVDLVVTMAPLAYSKILWNDGNGFFTVGPSWNNSVLVRRVADMNGDGLPDLVGYIKNVNNDWAIVILAGLGNGTFASPYQVYFSDTETGASDMFDVGDADGDGDLDIVGTDPKDLYVFANMGAAGGPLNFQYQLVLHQAVDQFAPRGTLFTDIDCDGKLDIVCWPVGWSVYDAPNASYVLRRNDTNTGYDPAVYQVMIPTGKLDLDGDGDEDLIGTHVFKNRHYENATGGVRKQATVGVAGLGGIVPTLGASGPFRVGLHAQMRLTGAAGSVQGLWYQHYLGETEAPFAGGAHHQASPSLYYPPLHITTSGAPGAAGEGSWSLTFEVPAYVAGRTKVYRCDLFDQGAMNGIARSNQLYITYGP